MKWKKYTSKNLVSSYRDDLEDTPAGGAELIQFAAFMRTQKPVVVNESAELIPCASSNLTQTFPNVEIALRIFLCLMVFNDSAATGAYLSWNTQRRAAVLNAQERLSLLALTSIEQHELMPLHWHGRRIRGCEVSKSSNIMYRHGCSTSASAVVSCSDNMPIG